MKKVLLMVVAIIFTTFLFAQTKTEVKVSDLPKPISAYVTKNMNGAAIDKAFKVVNNGVQTYDVVIKKGDIKHVLAFDKDGNFVKKADNDVKAAKDAMKQNAVPVDKPKTEENKK
jgi:hypothetical protein